MKGSVCEKAYSLTHIGTYSPTHTLSQKHTLSQTTYSLRHTLSLKHTLSQTLHILSFTVIFCRRCFAVLCLSFSYDYYYFINDYRFTGFQPLQIDL